MSSVIRNGIKNDYRLALRRVLLIGLLLICICSGQASAMGVDEVVQAQADAVDVESLERAAGEYAPRIDWSKGVDLDDGLASLVKKGEQSLNGIIKRVLHSSIILLVIVVFSSLASGAVCDMGKTVQIAPIAAVLAISAVSIADADSLIGLGKETIERINVFSQVLLPAMAAATAAAGAPGAAAARQMATVLFSDVLLCVIDYLLLPLVYAYLVAVIVAAALNNDGMKRMASTLKWVVTTVLTVVMMAFVGYLTISGVIAGAADVIAIKATKFTVSSIVPVVGGILSDAAETVLAGAGILKNSIGVFGMLVVMGMCIVPFLELGIHYLAYKITATLSAMIAQPQLVGLIDGLSSGFGLILGMTGASALLMLIAMISAIKVAGL